MNYMKIAIIVASGLVGGVAGYALAELISRIDTNKEEELSVEEIRQRAIDRVRATKNLDSVNEYMDRASSIAEEAIDWSDMKVPELNDKMYGSVSPDENDSELRDPYFVSIQEFSDENSHYDKLTTTFLFHDSVLLDSNEEMLEAQNSIGFRPFQLLREEAKGMFENGQTAVYVRNDKTATDYEVVISDENYISDYMGISDFDDLR